MVAPRIVQGGNVQVNGTAVYAAGEQVTLTMSQGLFDIEVWVGTGDANGIVHNGTTGGPGNNATTNPHRIYFIALPKNQALTMLLGGNIGFQAATVAGVENGEIILGSGWYVREVSAIGTAWTPASLLEAEAYAGVQFNEGNFTSDVTGYIMGDLNIIADAGPINFVGDLQIYTDGGTSGNMLLSARNGQTLTVGGDLWFGFDSYRITGNANKEINALNGGSVDILGDLYLSGDAGNGPVSINLWADNGSVSVGGQTLIDVSDEDQGGNISIAAIENGSITFGEHVWLAANGIGIEGIGDGFGGQIGVYADLGATITFNDGVDAVANGLGNVYEEENSPGDGEGGYIQFYADGEGSIIVNGNMFAEASGRGGDMLDSLDGVTGGAGYGGVVSIAVYDGIIDINGDLTILADGYGGCFCADGLLSAGEGGLGQGGFVEIWSGGPGSIDISGSAFLHVQGMGGYGQTGGDGYGGSAGVRAVAGAINLGPYIEIMASGSGGDATAGFGGNGGYGRGGTAYIEALWQPAGEEPETWGTITGGEAWLDVSGFGGQGGAGYDNGVDVSVAPGSGGDGQGGTYGSNGAFVAAASPAALALGSTNLISNGFGGAGGAGAANQVGGTGGTGFGGIAQAGNIVGDGSNTASSSHAALVLSANGIGGAGGTGGAGQGDGGDAWGGGVVINAKGLVSADFVEMYSVAMGGDGGNGGDARAGYAVLQAYPGSTFNILDHVLLNVSAQGGFGSTGFGGDAWGGNVGEAGPGGVRADAGSSFDVGGDLIIAAVATGGDGNAGGNATGGYAYAEALSGGSISANEIDLNASGFGGNGLTAGGNAKGGNARLYVDGGSIAVFGAGIGPINAALKLGTFAIGGSGLTGGDGTGGVSEILISDNSGDLTVVGGVVVGAIGTGGEGSDNAGGTGGSGGNGYGGWAGISGPISTVTDAVSVFDFGEVRILAGGVGGAGGGGFIGGTGGNGEGGVALVDGVVPLSVSGLMYVSTDSIGGDGGSGTTGAGGDGGSATAGEIAWVNVHADSQFGELLASASAFGGDGGYGSTYGEGGSATGGHASVDTFSGATLTSSAVDIVSDAAGGSGSIEGNAIAGISGFGVIGTGVANLTTLNMTSLGTDGSRGIFMAAEGMINATAMTLRSSGDVVVSTIGEGDILVSASLDVDAVGAVFFNAEADHGGTIQAKTFSVDAGSIYSNRGLVATTLLFNADGDLLVTDVDASSSAEFTAAELASFFGIVSAPTITVTSSDIDIAPEASIGVSGVTNLITLNAVSNGLPVIIGDDEALVAEPGQYHLEGDGSIHSNSVVFNAISAGAGPAPDILIYDVQIEGSQTAGGGVSSVTVNTAGSVFVKGAVEYLNAGSSDSLAINAGEVIAVVTENGSIVMTNSAGQLSGNLALTAHDIWVAEEAIIDQLLVDPNFVGLEEALATHNGTENQFGYVQAGGVSATMLGSSLLVQNSGTSQNPAGISVGDGGMTVMNQGGNPANVIVNGRQLKSNGTIIGGKDFAKEVTVAGPSSPTSTVNGCPIGGCKTAPPQTADSIFGPMTSGQESSDQGDESEEEENGEEDETSVDPSVKLINTNSLRTDMLIDEPITSGNDSPDGPN